MQSSDGSAETFPFHTRVYNISLRIQQKLCLIYILTTHDKANLVLPNYMSNGNKFT